MAKYKAVSYTRLSYANDKENESDSILNQKLLIEEFVKKRKDIEIVSEKVDDGFTGILFDRPAFLEMMEEIKAEKVNCVIVKDLSRFGRDYIQTGKYIRQIFPALGVRFIAINDDIDTLQESCDNLMVSVKTIINNAYSEDISRKVRSILEEKRKEGLYVGALPVYGYQKAKENKNQLVIDKNIAGIVKSIFEMKISGMSAARIADELNQKGVLSPILYKKENDYPYAKGGYAKVEGARWSATTILRILKDEVYTGTLVQGKKTKYSYKLKEVREKPKSEWIRVEYTHEAIISKQEFDLVQNILYLDTRTSPHKNSVYLFSGLLICGDFGSRMTRKTVTAKGKKYIYYYCPTGKKGCTSSHMIKEEDFIECVLQNIKAHIHSVLSVDKLLQHMESDKVHQNIAESYDKQIEEKQKELEKIKNYQSTLYESYRKDILSKQDYRILKENYIAKCDDLEKEISALRQEREEKLSLANHRTSWVKQLQQFSDITELDRSSIVQLIQYIKIFDDKRIEITFRYQSEYETALQVLAAQI